MVHCRTSTNNPACDHWSDNLNPPFLFIVCTTLIFRKKLLSTVNVINPATKSCADLMTGIVWQVWTSGEPSGTRYIVWCVCFAAAIWFSFHMYYTLALSHLITCKVSLLREMRSLEIAFKLDRWPSAYELNMKVSKMNLSRTYQERRVTHCDSVTWEVCHVLQPLLRRHADSDSHLVPWQWIQRQRGCSILMSWISNI